MRIEKVAVFDLFVAGLQGFLVEERLSRPCSLGPGLFITQFFGNPVLVRHPLACAVMGYDFCTGRSEQFVVAGLVRW